MLNLMKITIYIILIKKNRFPEGNNIWMKHNDK